MADEVWGGLEKGEGVRTAGRVRGGSGGKSPSWGSLAGRAGGNGAEGYQEG